MRVTVKLGSVLRDKAPDFVGGEGQAEIPGERATVADVMAALGIAPNEVNLIYRNHVLVASSAPVEDGDRVALFAPNFLHFSQFYQRRSDE